MARKALVTGAFLLKRLLEATDDAIIGLDNVNSYTILPSKKKALYVAEGG